MFIKILFLALIFCLSISCSNLLPHAPTEEGYQGGRINQASNYKKVYNWKRFLSPKKSLSMKNTFLKKELTTDSKLDRYYFEDDFGIESNNYVDYWKARDSHLASFSSLHSSQTNYDQYSDDYTFDKTNNNSNTYIVREKDTLWKIAKKYNTTIEELKYINNLRSNLIKINQRLILP